MQLFYRGMSDRNLYSKHLHQSEQHSLQQLNHDLKRKLHEVKKENQEQLETIDELQQQLAVLKAAKSELSEDEKKAFEKRLGQYIKEIDRCITILSE